jgi:GntR family transcriptional regulator
LDGNLKEGETLLLVRKSAAEYQLNPATVSKAYQMLQDEHHVYRQRGKGLFVKPSVLYNICEKERSTFPSKE